MSELEEWKKRNKTVLRTVILPNQPPRAGKQRPWQTLVTGGEKWLSALLRIQAARENTQGDRSQR